VFKPFIAPIEDDVIGGTEAFDWQQEPSAGPHRESGPVGGVATGNQVGGAVRTELSGNVSLR